MSRNRYCGNVIYELIVWWPLHSGKAFGWAGRILVFISGLLCVLLYVTGVIRWLQKRKAKTMKREKMRGLVMR